MPPTPKHTIGYAELYGRLLRVLHVNGVGAIQHRRTDDLIGSYFDRTGWPECLHGHVLSMLGVTLDPASLLNFEPASDVYPALGYPLTRKAATLADHAQHFADSGWTWGHAVELGTRMAAQDADEPADRRLGDDAVVAVLRHVVAANPPGMVAPPGWPPGIVALFERGYPTLLLGHLAAGLRVDAVTASALGLTGAAELFAALGWELTARARAVLDVAERAEASGRSWEEAAETAARSPRDALAREPWDR